MVSMKDIVCLLIRCRGQLGMGEVCNIVIIKDIFFFYYNGIVVWDVGYFFLKIQLFKVYIYNNFIFIKLGNEIEEYEKVYSLEVGLCFGGFFLFF